MVETKMCNRCGLEREVAKFTGHRRYCNRCHHLQTVYRITYKDLKERWEAQDQKCAICSIDISIDLRSRASNRSNKYVLDHCHETKNIRGLLCHDCNLMLGYAKDRAVVLEQAILYLDGSREDKRK